MSNAPSLTSLPMQLSVRARPGRILLDTLLLFGTIVGCHANGSRHAEQPPGPSVRNGNVAVPFEPAAVRDAIRFTSGLERLRSVVRDSSRWNTLWSRVRRGGTVPAYPPAVDFANRMVLVATMGSQPGGGHVITIDSVLAGPNGILLAYVTELVPGPLCGGGGMETFPTDMVLVPVTPDDVQFVERRVVSAC